MYSRILILLGFTILASGCGGGGGLTLPTQGDNKNVLVRYFNGTSGPVVIQTNLPTTHTFTLQAQTEQDETVNIAFAIGSTEALTVSEGTSASTLTTTQSFTFDDVTLQTTGRLDVNWTTGGFNFVPSVS
jgi:hypothetical protein